MKSKRLSEMADLKKSSKKLYKDYKERIIDVAVFGSFVKNKIAPSDIDLAVILKNTKEKEMLDLFEEFNKYFDKNIHLNLVLIEDIFKSGLFKTLIEEGTSLIEDKPVCQMIGYTSTALFSLSLTHLNKSKKVLFSYALHGKSGEKGMMQKLNGKEIGRAVIEVPTNSLDEFKQFLEMWGVEHRMMKLLKG